MELETGREVSCVGSTPNGKARALSREAPGLQVRPEPRAGSLTEPAQTHPLAEQRFRGGSPGFQPGSHRPLADQTSGSKCLYTKVRRRPHEAQSSGGIVDRVCDFRP